jgi:hypothetical protein
MYNDGGLKRWTDEIRPWAQEHALALGADDATISLVGLTAVWNAAYDPDHGEVPGTSLQFRIQSLDQKILLHRIRFRIDAGTYDVVYLHDIAPEEYAPRNFNAFLLKTPPTFSEFAKSQRGGEFWTTVEAVETLPHFAALAKWYGDFVDRWYELPPEVEDMHTISGYDEALIEAGVANIKAPKWNVEFMNLLKGLRGQRGWWSDDQWGYRKKECNSISWHSEDARRTLRIDRETGNAPKLSLWMDGWGSSRYLRNLQQVRGLPATLATWRATEPKNSGHWMPNANQDIPDDLEAAYQQVRGLLLSTPEIEDMHTISGYDEALIEAGAGAIRKELWKGELLELLKGLRGEKGWSENVNTPGPGTTNVSWYPPDHTNYYMYFRVERDAAPRLIVFVDPNLRGSTTGWRGEKEFKNYKAVLSLPKSLQAWVLSDLEKMAGQTNSHRYETIKRVAALGVPHDFERAYQRLRSVLIPAVEIEDMHTLSGYDESHTPLTEEIEKVFKLDHFPLPVRAGYWTASHAEFRVDRWTDEKAYILQITLYYSGSGTTKTALFANGLISDREPNLLLYKKLMSKERIVLAAVSETSARDLWLKLLDYQSKNFRFASALKAKKAEKLRLLYAKVRAFLTTNFPPEVERFTTEAFKAPAIEDMHTMSGYDEAVD